MTQTANSFIVGNSIHVGTVIPLSDAVLSRYLADVVSQTLQDPTIDTQRGILVGASFANELDLAQIQLDLSGYLVKDSIFMDQDPESELALERELRAVRTQVATAQRIQLRATPITVIGIPLFIDIEARRIPILWVTEDCGDVWLTFSPDPISGSEATFSARVNFETLSGQLRSFLIKQSATWDVKVRDLSLAVVQNGQEFVATAVVKVRYGILTAKVTATATITYDKANLTVTPTNIKVTSTNLIVLVALKVASQKVSAYENQPIDLNDLIQGVPLDLTTLDLNIKNDELRIQGRMA